MSLDELPAIRDVPTVTASQMAEVDRVAIHEYGIAIEMLMENASAAVATAARVLLDDVEGKRIVCLAGSGNNGGDALGTARRLHGWGAEVSCVLSAPVERVGPTTRTQYEILRRLRVVVSTPGLRAAATEGRSEASPTGASDAPGLAEADLIVDGLLGYSVRGSPRGRVEGLIVEANRSRAPILAIDVPSGLDPDTGEPLGVAIRAACTVTLALPKAGIVRGPARSLVGELLLADIGIPAAAYERFGIDARRCFVSGDLVRVLR